MTISVHTNESALTALQNLNKTNDDLATVQNRVNTGLKIANAKDNAAIWAIAQGQRADIGALGAVRISLERASSIAQVSATAGETISDLLVQLKEKVVSALDTSLDTSSRTALDSDFKAILRQITGVVNNAAFDGANLFTGSLGNIAFPGMTAFGGTLDGIPVRTSQYLANNGGSGGSPFILVDESEVYLADDGSVTLDASEQA